MGLESFLREAVLLLASAVVVVVVSVRLRVPPIVALLVTGVLIGPHGFGLVSVVEEVELFAEVGVALLLFTIGLEVSIERLRRLRRAFLVGGSVQVSLTTAGVTGVAMAMGLPWPRALFMGWLAALSSTALVLKLLRDRRETETPQGRLALAILLFQDFMIVPMIALTPALAGTLGVSASALAVRLGGAAVGLAVVLVLARRVLPRLLEVVVRSRVREVLPLGALALSLGMGWLTHSFGFSLALGSFLAGILLSGSNYTHQVIADVAPFRNLFSGIFFISIGMLLDIGWVASMPGPVIAVAAGVVALKIAAAGVAVAVLGYPARTTLLTAMAVAQVGEFSFVLMEVGHANGLLVDDRFQLVLAAAVVTLLATPAVFGASGAAARALAKLVPYCASAEDARAAAHKSDHVIVVGYGVGGRLLTRVLRESGIPYVVVELSNELVRLGRSTDEPMLYGDATREEILEAAGIERANVVAFVIADLEAVKLGVGIARRLVPAAQIIVRTRLVSEIEGLLEEGADQVVAEEFETAIEVFTRVLERYHVPRNVVRAQTRVLRGEGYQMLRSPILRGSVSQAVVDALAAGTTDVYMLGSDSTVAGRNLRELELRARAGATVIAVVRDGSSQLNPEPGLSLEAGDCLVLVGSHQEIDRAFDHLAALETGEGSA
ncbi:MAG: cation:proton antiporter [Acidobacteriota bacterium]|nr:cation:proton antiporter [Acidobacteriota bacterium]